MTATSSPGRQTSAGDEPLASTRPLPPLEPRVVVVPPGWTPAEHRGEPIVVGVDPDSRDESVSLAAFERARRDQVELVVLARSIGAQLIVLGRRHDGGGAYGLGPVAREVIDNAEVPVAIVPRRTRGRSPAE